MTFRRRSATPDAIELPSWFLLGTEPLRAAFEFASHHLARPTDLPVGDGHAVVLFPGLGTDRTALAPLSQVCESLGYQVLDWGRGCNTGPDGPVEAWLDALTDEVDQLTRGRVAPVSLIGWSLGGLYAREVAKRRPAAVRQVITLGTPVHDLPQSTHVSTVYRLLNGEAAVLEPALQARLRAAPPVPTTSVFSRRDGIVAWQSCRQRPDHPHCENVEVDGSHCGLCWNTEVMAVVADRLALPLGDWRPYQRGPAPRQRARPLRAAAP